MAIAPHSLAPHNLARGAAAAVPYACFLDLYGSIDGTVDDNVARQALRGQVVKVLPMELFYDHWGDTKNVTPRVIEEFVDHWDRRLEVGIRRSRLAVDDDHSGRALGWYKSVVALPDGLGASFLWNQSGRTALEGGEFAYFSPSIFWEIRDRVTGEMVRHQLGGGALTNYPYFGEETSLYSSGGGPLLPTRRDEEGYPARAYLFTPDLGNPTTWDYRVMVWKEGRLQMLPYEALGPLLDTYIANYGRLSEQSPLHLETVLTRVLQVFRSARSAQQTDDRLNSRGAADGTILDRQITGGSTMADLNSQLTDGETGGTATPPVTPLPSVTPSPPPVEARQLNLLQRFGVRLLTSQGRGSEDAEGEDDVAGLASLLQSYVAGQSDDGVVAQVAAMQTQLEEMSTQLLAISTARTSEQSTYALELGTLRNQLSVAEADRAMAQALRVVGENYSHLPGQQEDLAMHLRWLHTVDADKEQPHVAYFTQLFQQAEALFADRFRERGIGVVGAGDSVTQIEVAVQKYIVDHPGTKYEAALEEVLSSQPDLYRQYQAERQEVSE